MWMELMVGVMLSVCGAEDVCTHKVPVWSPVLSIATGILVRLIERTLWTSDFWLGLLVGLITLAIAAISGEQLGTGDGLVVTACGICLGWKPVLALVLGAMLLFLVAGVTGILTKKWNGKKKMAFVPYLWTMFLIICLAGGY